MDFSLYEDFPLFSGDVLVGLSPQPDELPCDATDEWQLPFSSHNADDLHKGLQYTQPKQEVKITIDLDNVNLFDTKVDLFDLIKHDDPDLSSPQHQHQMSSSPVSDALISSNVQTDELYRVSELLASDLQSLEYVSPSQSSTEQLMSPDFSSLEYNAAVLGDEDICEEVDSILSSNVELLGAAPSLSPVSTEDIDRVLQSGPTSPYSVESDTSALDSSEMSVSIESSIMTSDPTIFTIDSKYLREELLKPAPEVILVEQEQEPRPSSTRSQRPQRQKVRYDPYSPPESPDTPECIRRGTKGGAKPSARMSDPKSRKKQQNKDAALRYRMKKKQESSTVVDECTVLEKKNEELKDKVDSMTREIQYLKDLLSEVYQAKSTGFKSQSHSLRSK